MSFLERTELEHLLYEMPWAKDKSDDVSSYIEAAVERARAKDRDAYLQTVMDDTAKTITNVEAREKIYEMAATLAFADLDLHATERKALSTIAASLEISAERAAKINRVAEGA